MFKYTNAFTNRSGDSLPGYFAKLYDSGGNLVDIFADASSTPISTVSGVANAALSDENGMFRWYVANGTYDIRFYDANDVFVSVETGVPMIDAGALTVDLSADTGATLVGSTGSITVQAALNARPTTATLAASGGAALVGLTADQDVSAALGEVFSVGRDGALPATANNGTVIAAAFDAQKQATSISYNATTIPMDAKKSVQLSGQYIVKNKIDLWAKTSVIALNALNSGMTLAADATDNVLFRFSGSTALPAWGNQNNIIGGAYNILKAGGALVRKNPAFPRAFSDPGGSFMTNWNITDVSFAGPYGIMLGDVYSQQVTISDFHCVGTVEQILSVQGHYILIDGLDKTGFTGTTTEPLMVLGDPDNINPTTNITCRRVILDLNGNANKDSISIFNAKNTLLDEYHNELTAFDTMLRVTGSYGTRVTRSAFVTAVTTDLIALVNSDLTMDQYEANNTDKWWSVFTLDGQSPLVIDRLRQFNSGVVPVVPNIDVKEVQRVTSVNEKRLPIVAKDPIGNLLYNPAFMNGVVGWTIDGGATVQVLDDNEYIPGGKMLRITYAADAAGFKYINQLIPFMNVTEFDDKAITLTMVGKVTHGGSFSSTSYMGPCDASFAITEGRIYADQGLVFGSDIVVDSNGNAYFGIANPRAGWTYDIHFLEANIGRQRSAALPLPMDTGWTAATGTAAKGAYASYAGQDVSAAYVEAEAQATDDAVKALSQRLIALETAMREIGGIDG